MRGHRTLLLLHRFRVALSLATLALLAIAQMFVLASIVRRLEEGARARTRGVHEIVRRDLETGAETREEMLRVTSLTRARLDAEAAQIKAMLAIAAARSDSLMVQKFARLDSLIRN